MINGIIMIVVLKNMQIINLKREKIKTIGILITTGATEKTNLQNIYDIAGNVLEWTLEYSNNADEPCSRRGGNFGIRGIDFQADGRYSDVVYDKTNYIGFRISIY